MVFGWTLASCGPTTGSSSLPTMSTPDGARLDADVEAALRQAVDECLQQLPAYERALVMDCNRSSRYQTAITSLDEGFARRIPSDRRFPGRGLRPRWFSDGNATSSTITVNGCARVEANARALRAQIYLYDVLFDAAAEAVAWADSRKPAGELVVNESTAPLLQEIAAVFAAHLQSPATAWRSISEAETMRRLEASSWANRTFFELVSFVYFHELAHANLEHSTGKCVMLKGIDSLLASRGVTLTAAKQRSLDLFMAKWSRGLETQADIYSLTLLRDLGRTSLGPSVFFIGFTAHQAIACSNAGLAGEALSECALGKSALSGHPSQPARVAVMKRIFTEAEDLTPLLAPERLAELSE